MLDTLLQLITEFYPQIAGYVIAIALLSIVVWKAATFYSKTNTTIKKMDEIAPLLQKIGSGFSTLNSILIEKNIISHSCYSRENSPRTLNDDGKKLFEESGAKILFEEIHEELMRGVESHSIDSYLEAERLCLDVLLENMNDTRFKNIKNFAFEHPTFNGRPLTYTDILYVMSLELRDQYIKNHPKKLP